METLCCTSVSIFLALLFLAYLFTFFVLHLPLYCFVNLLGDCSAIHLHLKIKSAVVHE